MAYTSMYAAAPAVIVLARRRIDKDHGVGAFDEMDRYVHAHGSERPLSLSVRIFDGICLTALVQANRDITDVKAVLAAQLGVE